MYYKCTLQVFCYYFKYISLNYRVKCLIYECWGTRERRINIMNKNLMSNILWTVSSDCPFFSLMVYVRDIIFWITFFICFVIFNLVTKISQFNILNRFVGIKITFCFRCSFTPITRPAEETLNTYWEKYNFSFYLHCL